MNKVIGAENSDLFDVRVYVAFAASLPPSVAAAAPATLRAEVENLPDVPDDAEAAWVAELAPPLAAFQRQSAVEC